MAIHPKVTGPKKITFKCKAKKEFKITGEGFTDQVSVKLVETCLKINHDPERKYRSEKKGTCITVYTTPDGDDCGKHPQGSLTITVTNDPPDTTTATAQTTY
jgi:hypothetical protein